MHSCKFNFSSEKYHNRCLTENSFHPYANCKINSYAKQNTPLSFPPSPPKKNHGRIFIYASFTLSKYSRLVFIYFQFSFTPDCESVFKCKMLGFPKMEPYIFYIVVVAVVFRVFVFLTHNSEEFTC